MRFIWKAIKGQQHSISSTSPMSRRPFLAFQFFYLSRHPWTVARPSLTAKCLSRTCTANISDDSRGGRSKESPMAKLEHSFQLLGVTKHDCTVEQIRKAYIDLVKQYHPDSRTPHASAERFTEIRDAYKRCMSYAKNVAMSREIYAAMEDELTDIDQRLGFTRQRRLPHRQYLTYDVGPGTFSQRQKAYAQHRLYEAMDNVYEKQFEKALRNPDAKEVGEYKGKTKKFKPSITQTLERIAHEKIRDSMGRGEFKNLKGMGKPLRREHDNPVIDDMQQKLNRLLSDAGFAPEWIALNKEIRQSIENVKKRLSACWSKCGPHPMTPERKKEWEQELEELSQTVKNINKKINNFNLIVPSLTAQRTHVRLELLVSKVTATPPSSVKDSQHGSTSLLQQRTRGESNSRSDSLDQPTNPTIGSDLVSVIMRTFSAWFKLWQDRK